MGVRRRGRNRGRLSLTVHLIARGKIGRSAEAELVDRYLKRIDWPTRITELPDAGGKSPEPARDSRTVALDERGEALTSIDFASRIGGWRDEGVREIRFLIGAADGLTEAERAQADLFISFGALTWPHMMVRAMLAEQLWRASAILANHPYHREG